MAKDLIAVLPAGPVDRPLAEWSAGELLTHAGRQGIIGQLEVAELTLDTSEEPSAAAQKRNNMILSARQSLTVSLVKVHGQLLAAKKQDDLSGLLEALRATTD